MSVVNPTDIICRDVRVVDRAVLERLCTAMYPGFESRSLRQKTNAPHLGSVFVLQKTGVCYCTQTCGYKSYSNRIRWTFEMQDILSNEIYSFHSYRRIPVSVPIVNNTNAMFVFFNYNYF